RSKRNASTTFMLGPENSDFFAVAVHNHARCIRRFPTRRSPFDIDPVRQARDQIAAFGIYLQVQRLQQDGNSLSGGFHCSAIRDGHSKGSFASGYYRWELETRAGIAHAIDGCFASPDFLPIDPSAHRNLGAAWDAALGAIYVQIGGNGIAGTVTVSHKDDLTLEPRRTVGADVEFPLRRRVARERVGDANRVLASSLSRGYVPIESYRAVHNCGGTGCYRVAFRPLDLDESSAGASHRDVLIRTQNDAAHIEGLAGSVNGFVGGNMREIAIRPS